MDSVVKFILNQSTLDVTLIRITNATKDSFTLGLESRVTGTGPASATMAPMEVDLVYDGRSFGKLKLPEVQTSPAGADVNVYDQDIKIIDLECFKTFVAALITQDELVLTLDNGKCSITAFRFLKGNCIYKKDVVLKGMKGPVTTIKNTTGEVNTAETHNPSPVDIDHGISEFEIQTAAGEVIAQLKGEMRIPRGVSETTMKITRKEGVTPTAEGTKLVGKGTDGQAWTDDTIQFIQVPLVLTDQFLSFYKPSSA